MCILHRLNSLSSLPLFEIDSNGVNPREKLCSAAGASVVTRLGDAGALPAMLPHPVMQADSTENVMG